MVGVILEEVGEGVEPAFFMVVGVEEDSVGRKHGGVIYKNVVVVALPFLATHGAYGGVGRQGVGELVFVHVEGGGGGGRLRACEGLKGG